MDPREGAIGITVANGVPVTAVDEEVHQEEAKLEDHSTQEAKVEDHSTQEAKLEGHSTQEGGAAPTLKEEAIVPTAATWGRN